MHFGQLSQRLRAAAILFLGLVAGQAVALDCTYTIQGAAPFNSPSSWSCGQVPGPADTARILSNTVQLTASATVGTLILDGGEIEFSNAQVLTVQTQATLVNGTLNSPGAGMLDLAPGSNAQLGATLSPGFLTFGSVVLNNQGTVTVQRLGVNLVQPGASLVNRGSWTVVVEAFVSSSVGVLPNAIRNLGGPAQFVIDTGGFVQLDPDVGMNDNSGTIRVRGELFVHEPLALPGTVELEAGSRLRALGGLRVLGSLNGSSAARVFGDVRNEGTLRPLGLRISGDFEQAPSGTLAYAFTVPVRGALFVDGRTRFAGTIRTTTPGGFVVPANGQLLVEAGAQTGTFASIDNQIASSLVVVLPQTSKVYLTKTTPTFAIVGGSVVEGNTGTRPLSFGVSLLPPAGTVQTVEFAAADGSATQPSDFLPVSARVLTFQPGQTFIPTNVVVNGDTSVEPNEVFSGTLTNSSGPVIGIGTAPGQITNDDGGVSCTLIASGLAPFNDPGAWSSCSGGSGSVPGTPGPLDTAIIPSAVGPVQLTAPVIVNELQLLGGLIQGAHPLQVLSRLQWNDGGLQSTVIGGNTTEFIIGPDAIADADCTNSGCGLAGYSLVIAGRFTLQGPLSGALAIGPGIEVLPTGKFEVPGTSNTTLTHDFPPGTTAFLNRGVFTKSGSGTFELLSSALPGSGPAIFVNQGRAEFFGGNAQIEFYENTGITVVNGGGLGSANDLLLRAGRLESGPGSQTVVATVINQAAEVRPGGTGFGAMIINGNYEQQAAALLALQLDGPSAGSNADQLNVSGTVQLNGTLRVAKPGAFNPPPLSTYQLVNYENNFGSLFSNVINEFVGSSVVTSVSGTRLNGPGPTPVVTVANVTVNEAAGTATIVASVSPAPAPGSPLSVQYQTQNGTAGSPADFTATSGTLSFTDVAPTDSFVVTINNDALNEDDEVFRINLLNPTGGLVIGAGNPSSVTITNDDPLPTVNWVADGNLPEGNSGTTLMGFQLALSEASGRNLSVDVQTIAGTASGGKDFVEIIPAQTVVFNPGQTNRALTVTINGDTIAEANEIFLVRMSNGVNVTVPSGAPADATGQILNDDAPSVSFGQATISIGEGSANVVLPVTVSIAPTADATINFATSAGSALANADFTTTSGTLTFTPAGATTLNVTVPILEDALDEANEDFAVQLSTPVGLILGAPTSTAVTIVDNDAQPVVQLGAVEYGLIEGNSSNAPLDFALILSAASGLDVTVPVTTAGLSATSTVDYQPVNRNFIILAGQTSVQIPVQIIGDTDFEPDETFTVNLGNPLNASLGSIVSAIGNIVNDDAAGGVVCTWNGSVGAWNVPGNWLNCFGGNGVPANTPGPGDTAIINAGNVDASLPALITIARLEQRGSSEISGGNLLVTSSCVWAAGRQTNPSVQGQFTIGVGAVCAFGANSLATARQLDNRRLINLGTINFTGDSHTRLGDLGVIENGAPPNPGVINFNLGASDNAVVTKILFSDNTSVVNSAQGAITLATGRRVSMFTRFDNSGQVTVSQGELALDGAGIDVGRYDVAAPALLSIGNGLRQLNAPSVVAGDGAIVFGSAFGTIVRGDLQIAGVVVPSVSTVEFNRAGGASLRNLLIGDPFGGPLVARGGPATVSGTADITVTETLDWFGGEIISTSGTPKLLLAASASGSLGNGSGGTRVLARRLEIGGNTEWSRSSIEFTPSGGIEVLPTGSLTIQAGPLGLTTSCPTCSGTPALLVNRGELRKEGTGTVGFSSVAIEQRGTLNVEQGVLSAFEFVQRDAGALTSLNGGSIASPIPLQRPPSGSLQFEAGVLRSTVAGTADVVANVVNSGADVQPGGVGASGRIRIFGSYSQQLAGRSSFEVGGIAAGAEFDQLQASSVTLATGTVINTAAINGFAPAPTDTFRLLISPSRSGTAALGSNAFAGFFLDYSTPGEVIYARAPLPTLTLAPAIQAEGNAGPSPMNFVATLSSASLTPVTFTVTTADVTTTAGVDYTALSAQLISIPANTLSFNVPVSIIGDTAFETDETFTLTVANVTDAILSGGPSYVGTIVNDDNAGGITCTWNGSAGAWNAPANWLNCAGGSGVPLGTPGALDTAIVNSGDVNASNPPTISVRRFEQRGTSTLRGGSLTVTESCAWDSGTQTNLGRGPGAFTVAPGAVCLFGPNTFLIFRTLESRNLNNFGSINYSGDSFDLLATGALIANGSAIAAGVINFDLPGVELARFGQNAQVSPSSFVNAPLGVINFNSGALLDLALPFFNDGVVNISGAAADVGGDGSDSGRFSVASGSVLHYGNFPGRTLLAAAVVDGNGTFALRGNSTLLGNIVVETTEVGLNSVAAFNRAGGANLRRLVIGSPVSPRPEARPDGVVPAILTGTADIVVGTELVWFDGSITATSGTPTITVAAPATGSWPEGNTNFRNLNRRMVIAGNVSWTSGDVQMTPGRQLEVQAGGTLAITGPSSGSFGLACGTCTGVRASAINRGVISKSGAGDVNFTSGVDFGQQGQLTLTDGLLRIENFIQTTVGAATSLAGGRLGNAGVASRFDGGSVVSLAGVSSDIDGPVSNNGASFRPGGPLPGRIRVVGSYTQGLGSASFDIRGVTPITDFDQLVATTAITLNTGTVINTVQLNAFVPPQGQQFALMSGASRSGTAVLGSNAFPFYFLDFATAGQVIYGPLPQPTLTLAPASAAEGNSGTQPLNFVATLSGVSATAVTFNVTTTAGTATAGTDFTALSAQPISIPPNTLSFNVPVQMLGDVIFETDETLTLTVNNVVGANFNTGPGFVGTIQNDDAAPTISIDSLSVIEGNAGFTNALVSVRRSGASQLGSTVGFATEAGTALSPADFESAIGTLSFAPNEALKFILVRVVGDTVAEPDEVFRVRLSGFVNSAVGTAGVADITITNDDAEAVQLSICGARAEEGRGSYVAMLTRTGVNPISVTYFTSPISATPGQDYTPVSATVSWPANDTAARSISIPIIDDALIEPAEEFVLALDKVSPGGVLGTPNTQLIRIGDNDERIFGDDLEQPGCL